MSLSCDELRELLEAWAQKVGDEVMGPPDTFDPKEVVMLCLTTIAQEFGMKEANKAIDDFNLEPLGFKKKCLNL